MDLKKLREINKCVIFSESVSEPEETEDSDELKVDVENVENDVVVDDVKQILQQILEVLKEMAEELKSEMEVEPEEQFLEEIDFNKIKWGSLTRWLKQHYGDAAFNKDGTIKKSFVRKLLNDPNISEKIKRKIRFYLNVLAKK